jgi:hypothetical protein
MQTNRVSMSLEGMSRISFISDIRLINHWMQANCCTLRIHIGK